MALRPVLRFIDCLFNDNLCAGKIEIWNPPSDQPKPEHIYSFFFCVCSMLSSTRAPVNPVNWVMVAGQTVMFDFCIITWNINKPLKRGKTCLKNILRNYFFFFCNPLFELYSSCNFRGQMLQITSDFCLGSIISFCNWYNWNVSGQELGWGIGWVAFFQINKNGNLINVSSKEIW